MNGSFSGPRLRAFRRIRRIDVDDFALRVGRSKWSIWSYEAGRAVPPLSVAFRIADELGVSVDDLMVAARDEQAVGA